MVLMMAVDHRLDDVGCRDSTEPFFFAVLADPQLGFAAAFANAKNDAVAAQRAYETEVKLLKRAVEAINLLKPAFAIALRLKQVCVDNER